MNGFSDTTLKMEISCHGRPWDVKAPSLLKAIDVQQWSKFAALSLAMVTATGQLRRL
jgi:hypothetical protein